MARNYHWDFPLPRTHTGMLQGNGTMGVMIWGEGSVLRLTIGRADFWDHRGGLHWHAGMSFANIRACLEGGDEARLRELFARKEKGPGEPDWPSVLPLGRIELDFGAGAELSSGELNLDEGVATLWISLPAPSLTPALTQRNEENENLGERERERNGVGVGVGRFSYPIRIALAMDAQVLAVEFPPELPPAEIRRVTAWEAVGDYLHSIAFTPPEMLEGEKLTGWVQPRPADPPLCLGYRRCGRELLLATAYGDDREAACAATAALLGAALHDGGFPALLARGSAWWRAYWQRVPAVDIPNERLQFLYDYGMYKFAGLTNPAGVPATLQGPWIEEYQMPPWCSDYHFNINAQMCYWPAFHGNALAHLRPLFEMIGGWMETLRGNARIFLGIDDGLMLPHAVSDQGVCIGGFWSGSLDHGCTAWVAQMMYRYYRYTMDRDFLRDTAYPFMVGAMRVYEGMLEREGESFSLPVSVSPEYHTKMTHTPWGRNASFQLACIHRLCEDLHAAAAVLGETPRASWREIAEKLPKACLIGEGPGVGNGDGERIALWEGVPLEESHRHHSHLAGITPFDTFDLDDPLWRPRIARSLDEWIYHGPGLWSGWCVPWAAMLHTRFGKGEATELLLESWQRVFTNEGHGTLHDAHIPGFTLFGQGYANAHAFAGNHEVMQIEAGMACTAAIQEMLLHTRRGVNYLFAGAPRHWKHVAFGPMRTDGAFLVSSTRARGVVTQVQVESPAGGLFKLANPWGAPVQVHRGGVTAEVCTGALLEIATEPGETLTLSRSAVSDNC